MVSKQPQSNVLVAFDGLNEVFTGFGSLMSDQEKGLDVDDDDDWMVGFSSGRFFTHV